MIFDKPFNLPAEVIVDQETGLALNVPASLQEWPGWWNDDPGRYAKLKAAREAAGIVIEDFPNGTERIKEAKPKWVPMGSD